MGAFLAAVREAAPGTPFRLVEAETGRVLVPHLEVAGESTTRKKGLLGRDGLAEDAGLVIAPTNAVHTFFMRFSIDIVFVTRAGDVVKVRPSVPAWRMAAALRAYAVVELGAGRAARVGILPGTRLLVQPGHSG